jgi:hypothetical protein
MDMVNNNEERGLVGEFAVTDAEKKLPCKGQCFSDGRTDRCGRAAYADKREYHCTLPKGHSGRHVACGVFVHGYVEWE